MNNITQEQKNTLLSNAANYWKKIPREDYTLYTPCNGEEGEWFRSRWCDKCSKDNPHLEDFCPILTNILWGEQQPEWIYLSNKPVCTAYQPKGGDRITDD